MKLNNLYDIAERENVKIYNWHLENAYGAFINFGKIDAIAINYDEIGTTLEEKQILAEELGHYFYDATYPISCTDTVLMAKQERRAKKWSYYALIPYENLKLAIKNRNK